MTWPRLTWLCHTGPFGLHVGWLLTDRITREDPKR